MVYVIGIGPGNEEFLLKKAEKTIRSCDIIIGFKRAIDSIKHLNVNVIETKSLEKICEIIYEKDCDIGVVASGDPMYFGIYNYLSKNIKKEITIIPGISSIQYFSSIIKRSWDGSYLGSMHGKNDDFLSNIKNNKKCFYLTDNKNIPNKICEKLYENNIKCKVFVGENLSYDDEKITIGEPKELKNFKFNNLCVIYVEDICIL